MASSSRERDGSSPAEPPPIRSTSLQASQAAKGGGGAGGVGSLTVPNHGSGGGTRRRTHSNEDARGTQPETNKGRPNLASSGPTPSINRIGGGRRPVKVWNAARTIRKALVVSTYEEFHRKGREKLGLGKVEPIRVVLETDGTQVDDGEYFQTLPENSIFLFLRSGEVWHPAGTDAVRAVMEAIPSIVCDTLYSMGLHDQTPSWKIMDSRGRITVVLHWEKDCAIGGGGNLMLTGPGPSRQSSICSTIASGGPRLLGVHTRSISQRSGSSVSSTPCLSRDNSRTSGAGGTTSAVQHHSMLVQTSFDSNLPGGGYGPHITVINHDADQVTQSRAVGHGYLGPPLRGIITGAPSPRQLSRQGSSVESSTIVPLHHHTAECAGAGRVVHHPTQHSKRGSPTTNECDFHCCSLHVGPNGSSTASNTYQMSHKTVATSPIQANDGAQLTFTATSAGGGIGPDGKRSLPKGAHVRFSEVDKAGADPDSATSSTATANTAQPGPPTSVMTSTMVTANSSTSGAATVSSTATTTIVSSTTNGITATRAATTVECHTIIEPQGGLEFNESSESETENNEDLETANKFLLLVDQLSLDQPQHLSVKDIGIILERLSAKIIDVERLERDIEANDCHNWTIRATIRGETLRELGVIYNSNYYLISEHPGYQRSLPDDEDEDDDDEEDDIEDDDDRTTDDTVDKHPPDQ